jgi:dCMP deaminase
MALDPGFTTGSQKGTINKESAAMNGDRNFPRNDFLNHLGHDVVPTTQTNDETRGAKKLRTFMQMCKDLSVLSHDQKVQVATIIVNDNFSEICSIGYNGDYSGGPNFRVDMTHGQSHFLHSEENALFRLGKPHELRENLILICTHKPCTMCAKRIVNSGIRRVIYETDYRDTIGETDQVFSNSKVLCESIGDLLASPKTLENYLLRKARV